jgi:hypothetical protein
MQRRPFEDLLIPEGPGLCLAARSSGRAARNAAAGSGASLPHEAVQLQGSRSPGPSFFASSKAGASGRLPIPTMSKSIRSESKVQAPGIVR